jgi:hypothetical protein
MAYTLNAIPFTTYLQRFSSSAKPAAAARAIDTNSGAPRLAALASGGLVLDWDHAANGVSTKMMQLFNPAGAPASEKLTINSFASNVRQTSVPAIAPLPIGGFVLSWQAASYNQSQPGASPWSNFLRRYAGTGQPMSGVAEGAPSETNGDTKNEIVTLADGTLFSVWADPNWNIMAQRFAP